MGSAEDALKAIQSLKARKEQEPEDPAEDQTLSFGKFKGWRFSEVLFQHPDYAEWALKETQKPGAMPSKGLQSFAKYLMSTASTAAQRESAEEDSKSGEEVSMDGSGTEVSDHMNSSED